jgi:hypothetical protein
MNQNQNIYEFMLGNKFEPYNDAPFISYYDLFWRSGIGALYTGKKESHK